MKRVLVIAGRAIGILLLVIVLAASAAFVRGGILAKGGDPVAVTTRAGATDSSSVARGQHIVEAIAPCAACHGPQLAGQAFGMPPVLVSMAAPNLTPAGLGASYTTEDWDRAIRHGVAKDGRRLMIMPSANYASMSDADFRAVAAYLTTLPATSSTFPARKVGVLGRILVGTGAFPLAARTIAHDSVGLPAPAAEPAAAYGKYLITLAACADCHGEDFRGRTNELAGPDIRSFSAKWSVDDFRKTIRTGVDPTGRTLNPDLMPWKFYAKMTDDELAAVWAYVGEVSRNP